MERYAGIDLHSSNNYIGILDAKGKRVYSKRHYNRIQDVLKALRPYKKTLKGVAVESTYNWYWIVDGLMENGYKVHLANPSAMKQYNGLKYTDDKHDSFWLAEMLRLNILPEGYIYPKENRPLRDLLRKRLLFVRHRTANILSLQSMINRHRGFTMSANSIKTFDEAYAERLFTSPQSIYTARCHIQATHFLGKIINDIETEVRNKVKLKKEFEMLLTVTGIGDILGMTIMMEVGDISRFPRVGQYSSYCRCVESKRLSNGKKKGENNKKNGNKYLAWAYIEIANCAKRYCSKAQKFYQRKLSKSKNVVAIKALANKLSKATFYIMRDKVPYDPAKLFG